MSRKPFVPAALLGKLWRCIIEFEMLQEGDRVLIGLSGGKDSMFLTAALAEVQQYAPFKFDLACYTVDTMFSSDFPRADLESFCAQYGLKHYSSKVDVTEAWRTAPTRRALPALISAARQPTARRWSWALTKLPGRITMMTPWKPSF